MADDPTKKWKCLRCGMERTYRKDRLHVIVCRDCKEADPEYLLLIGRAS